MKPPPAISVDFNGELKFGYSLETVGGLKDRAELGRDLRPGERIIIYCDELMAIGSVYIASDGHMYANRVSAISNRYVIKSARPE